MLVSPEVTRESASVLGGRMRRRIEKKLGEIGFNKQLDAADLGDVRIFQAIEKCLSGPVGSTFIRALELLAIMRGRTKSEITVHQDIIEIKPAPKPDEQPPSDED